MSDNSDMTDSALVRVLRAEMARAGISMNEVSKRAGKNPGAVHAIVSGQTLNPRADTLAGIARALGRSWSEFVDLIAEEERAMQASGGDPGPSLPATDPPPARQGQPPFPPPEPGGQYAPVSVPPRHAMPRDVPVYGVAAGSDAHESFNLEWGAAVDYVARPPGIAQTRDVFALFVTEDSMEPRYFRNELVYVNPHRPARPGDFVIIALHARDGDPPLCYLKRLLRRNATEIEVEQYNPPRRLTYPIPQVQRILRVIPWDEVLGV